VTVCAQEPAAVNGAAASGEAANSMSVYGRWLGRRQAIEKSRQHPPADDRSIAARPPAQPKINNGRATPV